MRNLTIYLALLLCLFASRTMAQETFESRAKMIADKIESVTKMEKADLKAEVEEVNKKLDAGTLTKKEADDKKMQLAEMHAKNIENKVAEYETELKGLVQEKVDGKIKEQDSTRRFSISFPPDMNRKKYGERRTTSQFVLAAGFNNLVTDGALAHSDFGYLRSTFVEWGVTHNTRIMKENNLLHFKYGLTGVYNMLNPTDNRYFVESGNQTVLATYPTHLRKKDTYFKNVFITIPMHLEFDFSKKEVKDGKVLYRSHEAFRFGIGGFVGYNTNSKQFLSYREDGHRVNEKQKGDWNVNDWNYGLSAYVGYGETSLYIKYDLNPMFKDNPVKQNNVSLGVRLDLN